MPKVFIIILNWNGCADTIECIESLKKINYPDYKIVIVDNGSTDDSLDVIPKKYFQDVAFIETKKNLGFSGGNNVGIKYALENGADYVLLLNNDTTVEPDFLMKLVEVAESDKKIGIVGPMIMFYDKRDVIQFGGGKLNWMRTKGAHIDYGKFIFSFVIPAEATLSVAEAGIQDYNSPQPSLKLREGANSGSRVKPGMTNVETDYITGCCLLIKREVIGKIGHLSEDYFLYYEDVDWCLRTKKAGYKCVFVPSALIYHKQSRSAQEFSYPYLYYHSRNGLILSARFSSWPLTYLVSFWIFLKQMIKLVIGYRREWARPVMHGVKDFWRGKMGKLEGYY